MAKPEDAKFSTLRQYTLLRYQYQKKYQTRSEVRLTKFCRASKNQRYTTSDQVKEYLHIFKRGHTYGVHIYLRKATQRTRMQQELGITNLLFGIQQLGHGRVKTKRFRQLTPSAFWKQIMRPMLNQNENQALEQNQETQVERSQAPDRGPNNMPSWNKAHEDNPHKNKEQQDLMQQGMQRDLKQFFSILHQTLNQKHLKYQIQ
ncbi:MAG: hypothetical protein EZS28_008129 [Streblomastix strix]|uniref:Uncharacterized protein n=1 Tax=Streblomastix strix TaxID=222440 RepID=A0A5J4WMZ3_9EUKA|nr:MAG: hypothetical protein EZS28_008129 [Streblomastix strix]